MKDKETKDQPSSQDEGKLHISKSVFQTTKEMQQKRLEEQRRQEEEIQKKLAERERRAREARDRRLEEERKELIRLKQGLIQESETIHEEHEEEVQLGFFKKIGNFFYHNKWWLGIGVFCAVVVSFLVYSLVTKPRPDMIVLVIGEDQAVGYSEIGQYFEEFCPDNNGNGKKLVEVYYMPYSESSQKNYANGVDTKLTAELQSSDSVVVIGNKTAEELFKENDIFADLTERYPGNPHVSGWKFELEDTSFAQHIGVDSEHLDGWFLAVRRPQDLMYTDSSDMKKTFDRDIAVVDAVIADLSK
ncbi:MAG TPA: hypothetical protein PLH83_04770 [Ruminococcus sp.]|nr:hypothetical protein [Ruminococcus sp.]